jgi:hypothetical protein
MGSSGQGELMNTSRRSFAQLSLGAVALASTLGSTVLETACTFGTVFAAILKYVGVGLQAFQAVVDLLTGAGVLPLGSAPALDAIIALVKAGFADLQVAVTNYNNNPGDKTTLLGKISAALASLEANIQTFWSDLQIPDGKLAALVQGLLGIIISTLQGFATQLPAPAPTPALKAAAENPKRLTVPTLKLTPAQFKKRFNALLEQNGYPQLAIR